MVTFRTHRIPTPDARPYICTEGADGNLWFCESGAAKIGRLNLVDDSFTEFDLPTKGATPIGIIGGADGALWFAEKTANRIGRITLTGEVTEFVLPTPGKSSSSTNTPAR